MLPSKWPSCLCISNLKTFYGILTEISLFKKYNEKVFKLIIQHYSHKSMCLYISYH